MTHSNRNCAARWLCVLCGCYGDHAVGVRVGWGLYLVGVCYDAIERRKYLDYLGSKADI